MKNLPGTTYLSLISRPGSERPTWLFSMFSRFNYHNSIQAHLNYFKLVLKFNIDVNWSNLRHSYKRFNAALTVNNLSIDFKVLIDKLKL